MKIYKSLLEQSYFGVAVVVVSKVLIACGRDESVFQVFQYKGYRHQNNEHPIEKQNWIVRLFRCQLFRILYFPGLWFMHTYISILLEIGFF